MSPYDIEDDFGGGLYPSGGMYGGMYGLTEEDKRKARNMGLMSAGLGILAANQPSPHPKSALGVFGQGGLQGLNAYQGDLKARMGEKGIASNMAMNDARMKFGQQAAAARSAEQQAKAAQQQATAAQEQERLNAFVATLPPEQQSAFRVNPPKFMEEHNKQFAPKKPVEDPSSYREWELAKQNGYTGTYESWAKFRSPQGVSVNNHALGKYADKVAEGSAAEDLEAFKGAQSAIEGVQLNNKLIKHLRTNPDMNTGMLAEMKQGVDRLKVLAAQNEKAGKRVTDTEVLDSMLGSQVFPMIQQLGIGARGMDTPAEREFLRKVMTGTIELQPSTLIKMAEIRRDIAKRSIEKINARIDKGEMDEFFKHSMKKKSKFELPADDDGSALSAPAAPVIDFNALPKRR
jgi:hypothetical protein